MKICFLETEPGEETFFSRRLAGHELVFGSSEEEAPADTEVLSIFIYTRIDAPFLDKHPAMRLIATRSTGYDHIDLDACAARGIAVAHVSSYGDNTVAEHTFALILALSRHLRPAFEAVRSESRFSFEAIRGFDLKGKTLGVIGSGRIGLNVIRIARAFDMKVIAYDARPQPFLSDLLRFNYVPLDDLLSGSDIITLHVPLEPETRHLLNREALAGCRRGVLIINTARGGLIDTEALIEALDEGRVGGAGLDVIEEERVMQRAPEKIIRDQIVSNLQSGRTADELRLTDCERLHELQALMRNSELLKRSNVVFTPHTAFNSIEAVTRINEGTVANIEGFAAGRPITLVPGPTPGG